MHLPWGYAHRYTPSADLFRRCFAYTAEVSELFQRHQTSLRRVYETAKGRAKLLSLPELLKLFRALDLFDDDLSERQAALCFAWSRMCVIDTHSAKGRIKELNLPFEGFLEFLAHVSLLKGLPTDSDLYEARLQGETSASDAGSYILYLKSFDRPKYRELLFRSCCEWGQGPYRLGFGPGLHRRVEHLLHLLLRTLEVDCGKRLAAGALPGKVDLTVDELSWWKRKRWPPESESTRMKGK